MSFVYLHRTDSPQKPRVHPLQVTSKLCARIIVPNVQIVCNTHLALVLAPDKPPLALFLVQSEQFLALLHQSPSLILSPAGLEFSCAKCCASLKPIGLPHCAPCISLAHISTGVSLIWNPDQIPASIVYNNFALIIVCTRPQYTKSENYSVLTVGVSVTRYSWPGWSGLAACSPVVAVFSAAVLSKMRVFLVFMSVAWTATPLETWPSLFFLGSTCSNLLVIYNHKN